MAVENPSNYSIEPDPLVYTTRTATRCTATALPRNVTELVYDDKGAAHFDGDYEHLFTVYPDAADNDSRAQCWALANVVEDSKTINDNDYDCHMVYVRRTMTPENWLIIQENYSSGGGGAQVDTYVFTMDVTLYVKPKRVEGGGVGDLYLYIYDDSGFSNLIDTLHLALSSASAIDFRYVYMVMSHHTTSAADITFWVENLDLQEAAAGWTGIVSGVTNPSHVMGVAEPIYPLFME